MIGDSRMGRSTNRHGKAVRGKLQPIAFTVEYAFYPNSGKSFWRVVRDDGEIMSTALMSRRYLESITAAMMSVLNSRMTN